jgi:hypothetical protein
MNILHLQEWLNNHDKFTEVPCMGGLYWTVDIKNAKEKQAFEFIVKNYYYQTRQFDVTNFDSEQENLDYLFKLQELRKNR